MDITASQFNFPRISKPVTPITLKAIATELEVPGGGHLGIAYRLVKGDPNNSNAACVYGHNTSTDEVESHFASRDDAVLELTLTNSSDCNLKNVNVAGIRLHYVEEDGSAGKRADQDTLPDGTRFFEIVPNDSYFGTLDKGMARSKHLALTTRGVRPGLYFVRLDLRYDIEAHATELNLPLAVNPD